MQPKCYALLLLLLIITSALADDEAAKGVVEANNLFASRVYRQMKQDDFLTSPLSAEIVLSLLQSGSKGPTAEELRKGLCLPNNTTEIEAGFKSLLPKLKGNGDYTFETANKIYVSIKYSVRKSFKDIATEVYYAQCEDIDFSKNEDAADTINKWVEERTNNKIKNLISPNSLSAATIIVLVNALYFKANWTIQFPEAYTSKSNFSRAENDVIEVDMMHNYRKHLNYFYCSNLKVQFLELFLKGNEASMVFALPDAKNGLSNIEKRISDLTRIVTKHNFTQTYLNVALPKFKIETSIDFYKILSNIGITKIFDPAEADLSGIAGDKGDLVVSFVVQKTFADVNEGGVEAAAATAVGVELTSVPIDTPKNFVADHPFIYWIKVKGAIAFIGKATNPKY